MSATEENTTTKISENVNQKNAEEEQIKPEETLNEVENQKEDSDHAENDDSEVLNESLELESYEVIMSNDRPRGIKETYR